jgi:hypothetical protein
MGAALDGLNDGQKRISLIWWIATVPTGTTQQLDTIRLSVERTFKEQLGSITKYSKIFTGDNDGHKCLMYLQRKKNERIILVLNYGGTTQLQILASHSNELRHVCSVYLLNNFEYTNQENHDELSRHLSPKVCQRISIV